MTPFRASYLYVSLTWEPGEGIADTLGNIQSSLFLFLPFCFLSSLVWGGGRCFKCLTDQYLPPYRFSGIFCKQQNLIEVYNEQQIYKKEKGGGVTRLFLFLAAVGVDDEGGKGGEPLISSSKSLNVSRFGRPVSPWRR